MSRRGVETLIGSEKMRAMLAQLTQTQFVKEQLIDSEATWVAHPDRNRLDLGFLHKGKVRVSNGLENSAYAGLHLFGKNRVLGVIVTDEVRSDEDWQQMMTDSEVRHLVERQGGEVAMVTEGELENWLNFYRKLEEVKPYEEDSLLERLGAERAEELAGLRVLNFEEESRLLRGVEMLLAENEDQFKKRGVDIKTMYRGGWGMDIVFMNHSGLLVPLNIKNVRDGEIDDGVVREWVMDEDPMVVGMCVRKYGETKIEFYNRTKAIERQFREELKEPSLKILAVGAGAARLWEKLGFLQQPQGSFPFVTDQIMRAYRMLYMGRDTHHPGVLARMGLSLPGYGGNLAFPRVDGVFLKRDKHGQPIWTTVDNLLALRKGKERALSNVGGFVVFPTDMSFEEREAYVKQASVDYNRRTGQLRANLWHLDENLLNLIEQRGAFVDPGDLAPVEPKKAIKYFQRPKKGNEPDAINLHITRMGPEVGGNRHLLEVIENGVSTRVLGDLGASFDQGMPPALKGIGRQSPTTDGVRRMMTYGDLPMMPEVIEIWYLIKTAMHWPALANEEIVEKDPVAKFLVGELYSRLKKDEIRAYFHTNVVRTILAMGARCASEFRGGREVVVAAMAPTHAHFDHVGLLPFVDKEIMIAIFGAAWATLLGRTARANSWHTDYLNSVDITENIRAGQAYNRQPKDIKVYWRGGDPWIRLTPDISMKAWHVDHPVPGVWQLFDIAGTKLFTTGDWRMSEATRRAMGALGKENVDVAVIEATNLGDEKLYLDRTEKDVSDSLADILNEPSSQGRLVVMIVAPDNYERLKEAMEVAQAAGRKIALNEAHAISLLQMQAAAEISPVDAEGFDHIWPSGVLGEENVTLWAKTMSRPRAHAESLRKMAAASSQGALTPERLVKKGEQGKWVVFVTPYDILNDQFGNCGLDKPRLVYSAPSLYSKPSRDFYQMNKMAWQNLMGGEWISHYFVEHNTTIMRPTKYGPLHVSGHANPSQIFELLSLLVERGAKTIYAIHTDIPGEVHRQLERKFGRKVKIVTSLPQYDPRDPIAKPGAILRLD